MIERIQAGEEQLRDLLITDSMSWIKWNVRRITRSFFVESMDEFAIALDAFNQAISRFQPDRHVPFLGFARVLIERQLISWQRRQKQETQTLLFSECEQPEGISLADQLADPSSGQAQANLETQESIDYLQLQLGRLGLDLDALTAAFPQHRDTRKLCIRIGRVLAGDDRLFNCLLTSRRLPVSELSSRCQVPAKTIDRNRRSIIFLSLLINSDLDVIKSYLASFERE